MKFNDSGQDGLAAALQTVSTSSTGVARCKQAAMAQIKNGNFRKVLQVFDAKTKEIADPNDFKYGMGQKRLAYLFVLDAVCIGNIHSQTDAQISTETRQELVDSLVTQLPTFVERLATPCNCERIDKLLDGWFKRDKAPFFPQEQIRDARQRLHPSLRKRREKLATRIAATFVQTSKGKGLASYIPLDIPCMYGSFMPKLPSDATRNPSKASLNFGVDMLKKQLGDKYAPQCAPPSCIRFLNAAVGKFETSIGDDPYTAAWMWADEEEVAHRKRLKIEPPAVRHDPKAEAQTKPAHAAQEPAPKAEPDTADTSTAFNAQQSSASETKPIDSSIQATDKADVSVEPKASLVTPQKQPPGLGTWEVVDPDDDRSGPDTATNITHSASQQPKGPFGKFSGLKLTGASPQTELYSNSASPQPVSWLQPGANHLSHPEPLLPPAAPQYGAPAYEVMDVYAGDMYGGDTYGAQQYSSYHAADDFYQPPLPSEPYAPEEAPPLPDEPPPPLPDEPPPPPAPVSSDVGLPLLPVAMHAPPPQPDEAPPPLPDEPPPPLPDEPYDASIQAGKSAAASPTPPPPPVASLPPRSDTESGELVDSETPTARQPPVLNTQTHPTSGFQAQSNTAAINTRSHSPAQLSSLHVNSSEPPRSPPQPPSLSGPPPVAPPAAPPPPAEAILPPQAAVAPVDTGAPPMPAQPPSASFPGDVHAAHAWCGDSSSIASPARSESHGSFQHAAPHSHPHNPVVHHTHAWQQPPYPDSPWDVANTHSASVSPVPGDMTPDGHAQHMLPPHNAAVAASGSGTPEPCTDPTFAGQAQQMAQQQQYMMSMPQAYHQHPQQHPTLQPPPGTHMHVAASTAPHYPPHGAVPAWGHDQDPTHSQSPVPFPVPALTPGANSLPPSNPGSPMPGTAHPYAGSSQQQALPGPPPRPAGAPPPTSMLPGAPPTLHHMSAPSPGGVDMPAWGSPMPMVGVDGGYAGIAGPPGFNSPNPHSLPRPAGGMMGGPPGRQQGGHKGRRGGQHGQGYRSGGGRHRKHGP